MFPKVLEQLCLMFTMVLAVIYN